MIKVMYLCNMNIKIHNICVIDIYLNVPPKKLKLNESSKREALLSLQDISPWRITNSEECDVAWCNQYFVFLQASPLYF